MKLMNCQVLNICETLTHSENEEKITLQRKIL